MDRWECNLAAVWGQMSTGGGHSQLQETMSVLGVPVMSKASFISIEKDIGVLCMEAGVTGVNVTGRAGREKASNRKELLP